MYLKYKVISCTTLACRKRILHIYMFVLRTQSRNKCYYNITGNKSLLPTSYKPRAKGLYAVVRSYALIIAELIIFKAEIILEKWRIQLTICFSNKNYSNIS